MRYIHGSFRQVWHFHAYSALTFVELDTINVVQGKQEMNMLKAITMIANAKRDEAKTVYTKNCVMKCVVDRPTFADSKPTHIYMVNTKRL